MNTTHYLTQVAAVVDADTTKTIIAYMILVLPLFSLPFILKFVGGVSERFGLWANNKQRGLIDRPKNWAQKRGQETRKARIGNARARMTEFGQHRGYQKDDATGATTKRSGVRAMAARGIGAAGNASDRRERTLGWQQEQAHRIQQEAIFDQLAEQDAQGDPTARADRFARQSAGAGGTEGAERIRRLALEAKKKELAEEVNRAASTMVTQGAMDAGAYYYEFDKTGRKIAEYADHGRAMNAIARGENSIGTIKAGAARSESDAKKNLIVGDTAEKRYAAMKRMTDIGDGAALGYALYGDPKQGIQALKDDQISDFVQFAGDNASKIAPKLSHLITNDNGLNGVSGAALANWHGNEFKVAASRIRQLREQGNITAANKIQEAVENAYTQLASDPNLAQDFKQKHVSAMDDFNKILDGTNARVVMREYGDKMEANPSGVIADPRGVTVANVAAISGTAAARGFHL